MDTVSIEHAGQATSAEALATLHRLFPDAGEYLVRHPAGQTVAVSFSHPPVRAADPLAIWQGLFPVDGTYLVKARVVGTRPFQEWFLERLTTEARARFETVHALVRRVIEDFIREYAGRLADPDSIEAFERLLFDLRLGVRWAAANPMSPAIEARLRALGFTDRELLDFPGIAYRLGMIARDLARPGARFSWRQALQRAASVPLLPADVAAIRYARARAGMYLSPVLLRSGQAITQAALTEEQRLLRRMTAEAVRREMHPRDFARQLYQRLDVERGIVRDWERVARTEILDARLRGGFEVERRQRKWTGETRLWRPIAQDACNGCVRLYKNPDGTPRLYTLAALEAADADGLNRGPWREWRPRIGPTHPNCRDGPWQQWHDALRATVARQAPTWAEVYASRGLEP